MKLDFSLGPHIRVEHDAPVISWAGSSKKGELRWAKIRLGTKEFFFSQVDLMSAPDLNEIHALESSYINILGGDTILDMKDLKLDSESTSPWHIKAIAKGKLGEMSKIREELEEAEDAEQQGIHLMTLIELSNLLGAVSAYIKPFGLTLEDLTKFDDKVREVDESK